MSTATDPEANGTAETQAKPPFLRRVRIRGYKSIAFCDVTLEPLTILVGRNASGKSNFLDALAFLRDVVHLDLSEAINRHGGHDAIVCRAVNGSTVSIDIEADFQASPKIPGTMKFQVGEQWTASYSLEIDFSQKASPRIIREWVKLENVNATRWMSYTVDDAGVSWDGDSVGVPVNEWPTGNRTLLGFYHVSPYLELADRIVFIETYNFNPEVIRRPQQAVYGGFLERDGRNLASIIEITREAEERLVERMKRYLLTITTTDFVGVNHVGNYDVLRFSVRNQDRALEFDAGSMSDGTLRVLAALVAAFQNVPPDRSPSLVAIEEPETSLHPAAMRALVDALDEATLRTQILLTTHSAEMLDNPTIKPENIRVVQMVGGQTVIAPVDEASVEIVRKKLNTLGGLERENQLEPNLDDVERQQRLAEAREGAAP